MKLMMSERAYLQQASVKVREELVGKVLAGPPEQVMQLRDQYRQTNTQ